MHFKLFRVLKSTLAVILFFAVHLRFVDAGWQVSTDDYELAGIWTLNQIAIYEPPSKAEMSQSLERIFHSRMRLADPAYRDIEMHSKTWKNHQEAMIQYWKRKGIDFCFLPTIRLDQARVKATTKGNLCPFYAALKKKFDEHPEVLEDDGARLINIDEVLLLLYCYFYPFKRLMIHSI